MLEDTIRPTGFLDYRSPAVCRFVEQALPRDDYSEEEKAIRLYYAVRDNILYEIYGADMSRTGMQASAIIAAGSGLCIHKSIVYAAAVRSVGIPSRLVLTDVRNHLTSDRLRQFVGGDVFHYHCLVSVFIGGRWVKATPVFNRTLCQLYGMKPLEFDGKSDSLHHPYDENGQKFMEFIRIHGDFDDFPYDSVIDGLRQAHPNLFGGRNRFLSGSLVTDATTAKRAGGCTTS